MERKVNYSVKNKNGLTKEELDRLLLVWQKKLRMEDWKLDIKIVDFERRDFRQSGDFVADPPKKVASILMTFDPWRGDEEYTLVHELIHALIFDLDKFSEEQIFKNDQNNPAYDDYLDKLEATVHHLTQIILGRSEPIGK